MTLTTTRRRSSTVYVPNLLGFADVGASVKASATRGVLHVVVSNGIIDKSTTLLDKFVKSHKELEAYKSASSTCIVNHR
jgi:phenylalanine ammonia-lyase